MKLKFFFGMLSLCCLLSTNVMRANSLVIGSLKLFINDVSFELPNGPERGSRSIVPEIPFSAYQDGNSILLDFLEPIVGKVEVTISQNGIPVYSSSEDIQYPISKEIQLSQELSGSFLLEINGTNGAYAYAWFTL